MDVPESAFDPLYSTWYAFGQDVSAAKIEDEAVFTEERVYRREAPYEPETDSFPAQKA